MAMELCYTSAPKGLAPGSRGFCTVAATAGMPAPLIERLESLSGYRPLHDRRDANDDAQPVNWAHREIVLGGQTYSVLSRIGFAGADYTHRSNKLAHHVALRADERPPAGPAWVLRHGGFMRSAWRDEPRLIDEELSVPHGDAEPGVCAAWAGASGDAGWAGALAEWFVLDRSKPAYVIYRPGAVDPLALVAEAMALLSPALRWQVSFSTYFTDLPVGTTCHWRFVVAGTAAAEQARTTKQDVLRIDLDHAGACTRDGYFVRLARTGEAGGGEPAATARDASADEPYELATAVAPSAYRISRPKYRVRPAAASPPPRDRRAPSQAALAGRWRPPPLMAAGVGAVVAAGAVAAAWWVWPEPDVALELDRLRAERAVSEARVANLRAELDLLRAESNSSTAMPDPPPAEPPAVSTVAAALPAPTDAAATHDAAPEPAPATPSAAEPASEEVTPGPGVTPVDSVLARYAVALPEADGLRDPTPDSEGNTGWGGILLSGLPADSTVRFLTPSTPESAPLRWLAEGDGAALLHEKADALGQRRVQPVLSASLTGGVLRLLWEPNRLPLEMQRAGLADRVSRYSTVQVLGPEGQTRAEVQLLEPQTCTAPLGELIRLEQAWDGAAPRLVVLSTPAAWRAAAQNDPRRAVVSSPSGAAIDLALRRSSADDGAQFLARWAEGSAPDTLRSRREVLRSRIEENRRTVETYDAARTEVDAARAALPRRDDGGIDTSATQAAEHRDAWSRYTSARQRVDELRRRHADHDLDALSLQHAADLAELDRVAAQLRDVEAAVTFECLVIAERSKALLARVEVRP